MPVNWAASIQAGAPQQHVMGPSATPFFQLQGAAKGHTAAANTLARPPPPPQVQLPAWLSPPSVTSQTTQQAFYEVPPAFQPQHESVAEPLQIFIMDMQQMSRMRVCHFGNAV